MTTTALAILDDVQPLTVLQDTAMYSEFYRKVRAEVDAFVPDLSTEKSRGEIKSLAFKVTKTKTAIDAAGKKLNEDARAKINAVDEQRRKIRDELDALAVDVRRPLTEWERAEDDRQVRVNEYFDDISRVLRFGADTTIADLNDRLLGIGQAPEDESDRDTFRDRFDEARKAHDGARMQLETAIALTKKRDEDAAELARLRRAEQDRLAAEAERVGRELQEQRGREEAARLARLKETRAAIEAEEAKDREAEIARLATAEAEAKYKREIEAAQAEARAVAERAEQAEKDRVAALEKARREEEQRAANVKHRAKVIGDAAAAMERCGAIADTAHRIAVAIANGDIPNVTMRF